MRAIVLDTETTGLHARGGDRVIEVGCVELINHFPSGRTFQAYVNPERDVPREAQAVHGITDEFLQDKPRFAEIADDLMRFLGEAPLIIHNAEFDLGFLDAELERIGRPVLPRLNVVDTVMLARRRHPGVSNRLDDLCSRYGIDAARRVRHGALLDAELLAQVYAELVGARQATLALDPASLAGPSAAPLRARPRPVPLQRRPDPEEAAAHAAFIATLGATPLWQRYGEGAEREGQAAAE